VLHSDTNYDSVLHRIRDAINKLVMKFMDNVSNVVT